MRKTHATLAVLLAFAEDPLGKHWGYELSKQAHLRSGVLYPILTRMLNEGWVEDGWEDRDEITEKRPPRRYYKLTGEGAAAINELLEEAKTDIRFSGLLGGAS
jgi:PadR family transcriptional regulator PadR